MSITTGTKTSSRTSGGQLGQRGRSGREVTMRKDSQLVPIDEDTQHHLEGVRERVAGGIALRAVNAAQTIDGVKVGIALTLSKADTTVQFLRHVVAKIALALPGQPFLFVVAPSGPHTGVWPLMIVGSDSRLVDKAATLTCAKFLGRLREVQREPGTGGETDTERWVAHVADSGSSELDEAMLRDIVRKTPHTINPKNAPRGARGIAHIVEAARTRLERVNPRQALGELQDLSYPLPVVLVDIRPTQQREEHGEIPESIVVERTVLEWKFDPRCDERLSIADRYDLRIIVFDQEGQSSSLAAASLHDLGLLNATDVIGGYNAWKEAGLPTFKQPSPSMFSAS